MTGRLEGKRVVFVGGVANIGRAAVEAVLHEGASVVVGDIDETSGGALAGDLGPRVSFIRCDVTDEGSIHALMEKAAVLLRGIDGLCQNAGVQFAALVPDLTVELWDRTFAVNVRSQFLGAKHAFPHLKAAGGGAIVNTASTAGFRGGPGSASHSRQHDLPWLGRYRVQSTCRRADGRPRLEPQLDPRFERRRRRDRERAPSARSPRDL